jgi:hypothetical protein
VRNLESMIGVYEIPRLGIGEGAIDPDTRIANGEINDEAIEALAGALLGDELYTKIKPGQVPSQCVDGRGISSVGPNAAGGTTAVVIADALTHNKFRLAGEKVTDHAKRVFEFLYEDKNQKIGGHDDIHANGPNCGCGAQDKLDDLDVTKPSILRYISRRGDDIRSVLTSLKETRSGEPLNIEVSDEMHAMIVHNCLKLQAEAYATNGNDIRSVYIAVSGPGSVVTVTGDHKEAILVINTRPDETLDRKKVNEVYGDEIQVFEVDVTSLQSGAELLTNNVEEAHDEFIGALYYNVATAAVLAGASLRVIVR